MNYSEPLTNLLNYGVCENSQEWPNYLNLGFTKEHIPELIRMLTDKELLSSGSDWLKRWAPVHAWRVLGQLRAIEAVEPLLEILDVIAPHDFVEEEMVFIFGLIGPDAIPKLEKFLSDKSNGDWARVTVASGIEQIALLYPEVKTECVSVLMRQLSNFKENDPMLNGFIIFNLINLNAVGSISLIREVFKNECVDLSIVGDIEDVEVLLRGRI